MNDVPWSVKRSNALVYARAQPMPYNLTEHVPVTRRGLPRGFKFVGPSKGEPEDG